VQDVALRDFRHLQRAVDAGRRAAEDALAGGAKDDLLAALVHTPSGVPASSSVHL
jgi:hypothetical protein